MSKLGIYAGSFNPIHRGHLNILQKARRVFDKVIVARGINPEKGIAENTWPKFIEDNYMCQSYEGLLTDYIEKAHEQVGCKR